MYSNRSEYSHGRQYSDRSSRQWDGCSDRWEERRDPHRDTHLDSHYKYGGDRPSSTDRTSRSREYSDSPKRRYSQDSFNRDWSRRSPARRRMSSPDRGISEKKRRRFTEEDVDDYRYRRIPEDKTGRQSPDSFKRAHSTKDFTHPRPQEEDFRYRKTAQDSRLRYRHEEFTYRQQQDDLPSRRPSGYSKDRNDYARSRDRSQERTQLQDCLSKSYTLTRERDGSPSTDHEDHRPNITRFPLDASNGQSFKSDVTHQSADGPEQSKSTKGFQRFLDVLNKGVNVAMLTKIVTQASAEVQDLPHSPTSFTSTATRPWSPSCADGQRESCQSKSHWQESEGTQRRASPQSYRRSFSPKGRSLSDEKSLQVGDKERGCSSRSRSPSVVEKMAPEDENKHKHMQDVLQAIGMNLGFEELGQMSHRIQERLYGKKDRDVGRSRRGSRERDAKRAFSPRLRSRSSSSSRSSFSKSPWEYDMKKDSYSAQRDVAGVSQSQPPHSAEYGQNSSSKILQEGKKGETNSSESPAVFPQNPSYTLPESSPAPVMPVYSPVNCSPLPYPPLPPNLPHVGPRLFLPRLPPLPPLLPYPLIPPLNIFPAVLAQTRHLLPQHISNPHPLLNLASQPLNTTQKAKPLSRPRCLQVIETKQPG